MADLSDVMNVLAATVAGALYPGGVSGPGEASVAGPVASIYPGWPNPRQLDNDLPAVNPTTGTAQNIVHVNIYTWKEDRNTTRYMENWQEQSVEAPTITAAVEGVTITLGGVVGPGQNIAVIVNATEGVFSSRNRREAFVYQTVAGDTLASAAAALAALIAMEVPGTTASGAVITCSNTVLATAGSGAEGPPSPVADAFDIVARVGGSGTGIKEIRRQERIFQVGIWAGNPGARDAVAKVVDPALSESRFLTMPDGFGARIIYHGSMINDSEQKMGIYRRELLYRIEYATTLTEKEWRIVVTQENIDPAIGGIAQGPVTTIYE